LRNISIANMSTWIRDAPGRKPLPGPTTLEEVFERYVDINGPPGRDVMRVLAAGARDPAERMHLQVVLGLSVGRWRGWLAGLLWRLVGRLGG